MGGSDEKTNIIALTAKEHFIIHHLLTKMCICDEHTRKMWSAFFLMHVHSSDNRFYTSRTYLLSKIKMAENKKMLIGEKNHFYGKKHNEDAKCKMREKRKGRECRVDQTIYRFIHPTYGPRECRRIDLSSEFSIDQKLLYKLVTGKTKSVYEWRLDV
jgi:hypothetical protein